MDTSVFHKPFGVFVDIPGHKAFVPHPIPPRIHYGERLVGRLAEAERHLGGLESLADRLPSPRMLERVFTNLEAVESSRIEGTTATLDDTLKWDLGVVPAESAGNLRMQEVLNCKDIMKEWWENRPALHLDISAIEAMHIRLWRRVIQQPVLDEFQTSQLLGKFRVHQNWIGGGGDMRDSTYVPPPPRYVPDMMESLVEFINDSSSTIPHLLRCAIIHYQFEAIHPFHDGNGRVGRIILGIMLARDTLPWPLDVSGYLRRNQLAYYNRLSKVSTHSQWNEWFMFFLEAVLDAAKSATGRIKGVLRLSDKYKRMARGNHGAALVDILVEYPYVTIPQLGKRLSMSYPGVKNLVESFVSLGILAEMPTYKKPRLFCARQILSALGS